MTTFSLLGQIPLAMVRQRALAYVELTKPRLSALVLVTAAAGFWHGLEVFSRAALLVPLLAGMALAVAGANALNQWQERDADALMERTRHRPLPDGRIQPGEALVFGVLVTAVGLLVIVLTVNALSAFVTAFIVGSYLFVYTPLKQKSSLCGVIGAVPGALPPVIGWTAANGGLGLEAWLLFAILFLWQIPHTLAIARLYRDDFARAGIRFLPVVEPDGGSTGRQIISHCLALLAVSLLPTLLGLAGSLYFMTALFLGAGLLAYGVGLAVSQSLGAARRLLFASLIYLPVILVVMALDRARW
jgi:protoheme IX farnesyltransferase